MTSKAWISKRKNNLPNVYFTGRNDAIC